MKNILKTLTKIVLLFLMVYSLGHAVGYLDLLNNKESTINIYLNDSKYDISYFNTFFNTEEKDSFFCFRQRDNQIVINNDLQRSFNTNVIYVYGNLEGFIKTPVLFEDDIDGCLIDEDTSYELFGSKDVVGKKIDINERTVIVRGIQKESKNTIIIRELDTSKERFDGISLKVPDKETLEEKNQGNAREYINYFIMKYNLNNLFVSSSIYGTIANLGMILFIIIIILYSLESIFKNMNKYKNKPVLKSIIILGSVIYIWILKSIAFISFKIPLEVIPSKWSNFERWSEIIDEYQKEINYFICSKKYSVDILKNEAMLKAILYIALTISIFMLYKKFIKVITIKDLFLTVCILLICSFITVIITDRSMLRCNYIGIWSILPFHFIFDYIYCYYKENK